MINMYPEIIAPGQGASQGTRYALYGTPGTTPLVSLGGGPIRALCAIAEGPGFSERLIAVAGNAVYAITANGGATLLGTITTESLPAQIHALNTDPNVVDQFVVLSAGNLYSGSITNSTLTQVQLPTNPDGNVIFARTMDVQDGYVIVSEVDSRRFYISNLEDPRTWNPLNFATKEANPDFLQGVYSAYEYLYLFGLETVEIWYNSGAANFPFQRLSGGGVTQAGCVSPWSICELDNTIIWLGRDPRGQTVVWELRGLIPVRVSTHAVEHAFNAYGSGLSQAVAYTYQEEGHHFYVLTLPTAGGVSFPVNTAPLTTWVYDSTTGLWHERGVWNGTNWNRVSTWYHAMAFFAPVGFPNAMGHYVGGGEPGDGFGVVFKQSLDVFQYNINPIRRLRAAPHVSSEKNVIRHVSLQLDVQMGVVPSSGPASTPSYNLNISSDGGRTFGPNLNVLAGTTGQYTKRAIWRRLGRPRDRVYQVWTEDAVQQAWVDAYLRTTPGTGY